MPAQPLFDGDDGVRASAAPRRQSRPILVIVRLLPSGDGNDGVIDCLLPPNPTRGGPSGCRRHERGCIIVEHESRRSAGMTVAEGPEAQPDWNREWHARCVIRRGATRRRWFDE